jgi:hypothetical protein
MQFRNFRTFLDLAQAIVQSEDQYMLKGTLRDKTLPMSPNI